MTEVIYDMTLAEIIHTEMVKYYNMEKIIYKFTIPLDTAIYDIEMPLGANVISVQEQQGRVSIWALCNPDALYKIRTFTIVYTGWKTVYNEVYLATIQSGGLVYHIFEVDKLNKL